MVAKVVTPFANPAIVLDRGGNGVDLGGAVQTLLFSGVMGAFRWPRSSDDVMVAIDATSALAGRLELRDPNGSALTGATLVRGGVTLVNHITNVTTILTDGRQLMRALDSNGDGRVDASDPGFAHLRLFTDSNANGAITSGEVSSLAAMGVAVVGTPGSAASRDAFGNLIDIGTFIRTNLSVGVSNQVTFKLF